MALRARTTPASIEERPFVVIEPPRRLDSLHLRELWAYRELLYFLVWRDVKVRYKQTLFGGPGRCSSRSC